MGYSQHSFIGHKEDLMTFGNKIQEWYLKGKKEYVPDTMQGYPMPPKDGWLGYIVTGAGFPQNNIAGFDLETHMVLPGNMECDSFLHFYDTELFDNIFPYGMDENDGRAELFVDEPDIGPYNETGHPFKTWRQLIEKSGLNIKHTALYERECEGYSIFDPDRLHYYDSFQYALNFSFTDGETDIAVIKEIQSRFDKNVYPAANEEFGEYLVTEQELLRWLQNLLKTEDPDLEKLIALAENFNNQSSVCPKGFDGWINIFPIKYITEI